MKKTHKKNKNNKYDLSIGDLVKSLMGRDSGGLFVVVKIIDDDFVYICDGKSKLLKSPKKKRKKHLKKLDFNKIIQDKLLENKKVFDSEINGIINKFQIEREEPNVKR